MPAYNEERAIGSVLEALPRFIKHIVVVDDHSPDRTGAIVAEHARHDPRIVLCVNQANLGVGGATIRGFEKVLELGAHVVVKLDADGQCRPEHSMRLAEPLIRGEADYAKGNRFRHLKALRAMPLGRRIGNVFLTFLAKKLPQATGIFRIQPMVLWRYGQKCWPSYRWLALRRVSSSSIRCWRICIC